ncbi:cysteine-rich with EGF-like domain protein 2 [Condylostylus longicornis]|uniref:cysteine-rich with EGF-like domain protein 2 n=1 Tax=Condylostylus longicornis TaxID=2530218 RepID=UPI00244DF907|nr:cysteine-rich with EGF-like domain protein 2 [Condylostylus longicornis]
MSKLYFFTACIIFVFSILEINAQIKKPPVNFSKDSKEKSTSLPPCRACHVLIESFNSGLKKTERGKHEGGDAAWEEQKLGSYKNSELRLTEIQEFLCSDVKRGQDQCHTLASDSEELLEEWWFNKQTENPDLYSWLCIDKLKVCCPENHYGPDCLKCSDCYGNGKCKGNGTRKGNGKCACDAGYSGDSCMDCDIEYYESYRDEKKLLCTPCHVSCGQGGCTGASPKGCRKCKNGWVMNPEVGCFDINECVENPKVCTTDQFCVNNEGSYSCLECDRSCKGCTGDGPDMCMKCAENYSLRDGKCIDLTSEKREQWVTFTRFLTYLGLCVATCAIFHSSTYLAAFVGTIVAIYIAVSEYWLNTLPSGGKPPKLDTEQLEELIKNSL